MRILLAVGSLVASIAFPLVGGFAGGLLTAKEIKGWYKQLKKPSWNPPNWLFGPAWTCIYTLMGVSSWLVWRQGGFVKQAVPLGIYAGNVLLNWLWTPLFFAAHRPDWAMVNITGMWGSIIAILATFAPVSKPAALLMLPYFGWVSFASCLNFWIWRNNPNAHKLGAPEASEATKPLVTKEEREAAKDI